MGQTAEGISKPSHAQKNKIEVDRAQIDAVIAAESDAATEVLQAIYTFVHGPAFV